MVSIDKKTDSPEVVYQVIKNKYLLRHLDNHTCPQYKFLTDEKGELYPNITILRTETLTQDMKNYGYKDFNGKSSSTTYDKYLNADSIQLINETYKLDFEMFGYKMR